MTTYPAQLRCMFCNCLLGISEGFTVPDLVTHGLGECCLEFALTTWVEVTG